ncbi:MAG TPA: phosphoglycerate kinase [Methyloceanibacter sp.]|jgi:phosphoglycerate kinase|nr:phosphoglycerate kinase [Methyloceanibacter sp.]
MNEASPAGSPGGLDLSRIKTIDGVDVRGKRVLIRVDFNVPIEGGKVADPTRISRVLPTIAKLAHEGAKVIVLSHLGRPKGVISPETSLKPVADKMKELMAGTTVRFIGDCLGEEARNGLRTLRPGDVAVLENVRFYPGEEKNDPNFAKRLAEHGDLYVDDAFSSAHRAHASIEAITRLLPSYAGLLMMAEITALGEALETPERPVMAIVGGAKVSTKIEVLTNLVARMDTLVVGGGMANTFLLAKGMKLGASFAEPDFVHTAKDVMARANAAGCAIVLPSDAVVAKALAEGADWQVCPVAKVPQDAMILDFGPDSVAGLKRRLADIRTVLWNGPLGAFETPPFGAGTFAIAKEVARLTQEGKLISVAGGGDTVRALNEAHVADDFSYVSTAGGAFLEWLGGHELPAVAALARNGARA